MTVEKISEVPRINLTSQKSPNITIKADKIRLGETFEETEHKHKRLHLTCPRKIKIFIFRNNKKESRMSNRGVAVGRDLKNLKNYNGFCKKIKCKVNLCNVASVQCNYL